MRLKKPPSPVTYSAEEQKALIDFMLAQRKPRIQELLKEGAMPRSGTKQELRQRLQQALNDGDLAYERLVDSLDSVAPWGKQHVFLYEGSRSDLQAWKDPGHTLGLLEQHGIEKLFNTRLPLILPDKLTLSSVTNVDGCLRVTAIAKREYDDRTPEYDEEKETKSGERIRLKAYIHRLTRTLVAFEWDLNANVAMLQITQLPGEGDYDEVAEQFRQLVKPWLDIKQFSPVDLRPVIQRLHAMEKNGKHDARSHGFQYRSPAGRRISGHSPSSQDSVLGEPHMDDAMDSAAKGGVGHLGNFYWLAGVNLEPAINPLTGEVHVIIVGAKSRINFPTPNSEDVIRYVLHRVRALS